MNLNQNPSSNTSNKRSFKQIQDDDQKEHDHFKKGIQFPQLSGKSLRIAIIRTRWNEEIVDKLVQGYKLIIIIIKYKTT